MECSFNRIKREFEKDFSVSEKYWEYWEYWEEQRALGRIEIPKAKANLRERSEDMEWISVDDALPADGKAVLMMEVGQGGLPLVGWYHTEEYIAGFYPDNWDQELRMHVTHWLLIPKRPEQA